MIEVKLLLHDSGFCSMEAESFDASDLKTPLQPDNTSVVVETCTSTQTKLHCKNKMRCF